MSITLYGIKNCDTVKKERALLDTRGVQYQFHDYKLAGIDRPRLERWCREAGWSNVLNRNGTTFRKLPDLVKTNLDAAAAIELMLAQPSLIKRPIVEVDGRLVVGFSPETYGLF
jgi:Spx/MgsR family transcriptional regulator